LDTINIKMLGTSYSLVYFHCFIVFIITLLKTIQKTEKDLFEDIVFACSFL